MHPLTFQWYHNLFPTKRINEMSFTGPQQELQSEHLLRFISHPLDWKHDVLNHLLPFKYVTMLETQRIPVFTLTKQWCPYLPRGCSVKRYLLSETFTLNYWNLVWQWNTGSKAWLTPIKASALKWWESRVRVYPCMISITLTTGEFWMYQVKNSFIQNLCQVTRSDKPHCSSLSTWSNWWWWRRSRGVFLQTCVSQICSLSLYL